MGWDIQINPTAESLPISHGLAELLDPYLEDFNIRYAFVEPNPSIIAALKSFAPRNYDEAQSDRNPRRRTRIRSDG